MNRPLMLLNQRNFDDHSSPAIKTCVTLDSKEPQQQKLMDDVNVNLKINAVECRIPR